MRYSKALSPLFQGASRVLSAVVLSVGLSLGAAPPVAAFEHVSRDGIETFLDVTGFDVALDSVAQAADSAPGMLGLDPTDLGPAWTLTTREVFAPERLHGMALEFLEATLSAEQAKHAQDFYGSELGRKLVELENASHVMEDDEAKSAEGEELVAEMVRDGSPRLQILKRMNKAIDASGSSVTAMQEVQMRFLLAASAAGLIDLDLDADMLADMQKAQEGEMRRSMQTSALANAAYTYRELSDAELEQYAEALEQPLMQEVYALLNAIQFEIMANRFEVLAGRMSDMAPGQDI
ncbi:DUF2059 domain-containing protein [Chachezhania sediminis]|uniref:DUF2059 domain-containing protein n=1 Tax=Chachezhania sediminis TaxID=2599291 RepID=UPI00131B73E6|nr:DUF2059 domain-containing protein [Chachezhania sediminis]